LARALVDEFHLTPRPTTLKNNILATVALQVSYFLLEHYCATMILHY
jgi:hypothetical protein